MQQFEEKFGKRVLVSCHDLLFNLQGCVAENEERPTTNVCISENPAANAAAGCACICMYLRTNFQLNRQISFGK